MQNFQKYESMDLPFYENVKNGFNSMYHITANSFDKILGIIIEKERENKKTLQWCTYHAYHYFS